jgi:glucokinase
MPATPVGLHQAAVCRHDRPLAVGVDIGGTKVGVALVDADGCLLHEALAATPRPPDGDSVAALMIDLVANALAIASSAGRTVEAIGVGTAGVISPSTGAVASATNSLINWTGVDIRSRLRAISALPVVVVNDVNAMAVAEVKAGAGREFNRFLVVAVGTGIGGALVRDGRVDHGASGTAGEIGHLPVGPVDGRPCGCGRFGHLEAYCSGPSMARRYIELSRSTGSFDFEAVVSRARDGEPIAVDVVLEGASILGRAIGGLVNVLDPEAVVLGGGVVSAGQDVLLPFERSFRAELLPGPSRVALRYARFGSTTGVVGAALNALTEVIENVDESASASVENSR